MFGLQDGTIWAFPLSSRIPIWRPQKPENVKFKKNRDNRRCISAHNEIPTALLWFCIQLSIEFDRNTVLLNRKWKNPRWRSKISIACIFASRLGNQQDLTEIPTAKPSFSRSKIPLGLLGILWGRTGSGKIQDGGLKTSIAFISAHRQDINDIPTAVLMFLGSSFPLKLVRILCDRTGSGKIQRAAG